MGFKVQEKKNAITLDVEKVLLSGEIAKKTLVFDCDLESIDFVRGINCMMRDLEAITDHEVTLDDVEPLVSAERHIFESLAPGKWDEYFDFIDHNYVDMGKLVAEMFHMVIGKHIEALDKKREEASPVIPDNGEKI